MKNTKCIADFPINVEDEYNMKEYFIQCMYVVSKMKGIEFDNNIIKLYYILDDNGTIYNGFIAREKDIESVEYHVSSKVTKECRKELKRNVSLDKLIDYILTKQIVISGVKLCDTDKQKDKIRCINRSYEKDADKLKAKNISRTLVESTYARKTFGEENSYLKKVFTNERILNDAKEYYNDLISDEKRLFLSSK